jgi:hypothetical protein
MIVRPEHVNFYIDHFSANELGSRDYPHYEMKDAHALEVDLRATTPPAARSRSSLRSTSARRLKCLVPTE